MSSFSSFFRSFPAVGFSGCRLGAGGSSAAAVRLLASVPSGVPVLVGCASGVDWAVRGACPSAVVFFAGGRSASSLVARSVACVSAVVAARGVWCSFPSVACPVGLVPSVRSSRCFCGSGSGSWASLCLAVGLGAGAVLVLPVGVVPPSWVLSCFVPFGSRCWVYDPLIIKYTPPEPKCLSFISKTPIDYKAREMRRHKAIKAKIRHTTSLIAGITYGRRFPNKFTPK